MTSGVNRPGRIRTGEILALATAALGLIVFTGWCLHAPALIRFRAGAVPMQADTALGFLFAGIALFAFDRGRRLLVLPLASILFIYGTLTIIELTVRADFGIHYWHLGSWLHVDTINSNPMPRGTAAMFAMLGGEPYSRRIARTAASVRNRMRPPLGH